MGLVKLRVRAVRVASVCNWTLTGVGVSKLALAGACQLFVYCKVGPMQMHASCLVMPAVCVLWSGMGPRAGQLDMQP